jgi:hypothetical protein
VAQATARGPMQLLHHCATNPKQVLIALKRVKLRTAHYPLTVTAYATILHHINLAPIEVKVYTIYITPYN